ncbi:DUF1345 domain-containing protein [Leifsonia sp. 2MCAF36]|uniref:DUF1345 domain-containing protein n=1 Tax=Leifsonia sp. 2MCAF36 TaxID=3232988 RepID=UPI003F94540A
MDVTTSRPAIASVGRRILVHLALSGNLLVQLVLVAVGILLLLDGGAESTVILLAGWCLLAFGYVVAVAAVIAMVSRPPRTAPGAPLPGIYLGWAGHVVAATSTLLASLCGIAGAVQVKLTHGQDQDEAFAAVVGTAAMLLSWLLLHWGYAQFYHRRHIRAPRSVLAFPGTERPRLSDFVYFAFTVGTTFAASDVKVLSPRLRWVVTKHSIISFFYNGAIIVLAFNTLTAAR